MRNLHHAHNLYAAVGGLLAFIIMVLAAPLIAAADDGPQRPAVPVAYGLQGDTTNSGSNFTSFNTSSTNAAGGWRFGSSGSAALTMFVDCTGGNNCRGISASGGRQAIRGESKATTVNAESYGVVGISNGTGKLAAGGYFSSTGGFGIAGYSNAVGGVGAGGYFSGTSVVGVYTESRDNSGIFALSAKGAGVVGNTKGISTASFGVLAQAVATDTNSVAIALKALALGQLGTGVLGIAPAYGVRGQGVGDSTSYGGYFTATAGIGLYGSSSSKFGVFGESSTSIAVLGISSKNIGVEAKSDQSTGLVAVTNHGTIALRASNNSGNAGSFAGIFDGDVQINGNLTCSPACVAAMGVSTDRGERLVYAEAGTQSRLSDEGSATLKDGHAVVKIDPLFAQAANVGQPYVVLVVPNSADTAGLAVVNKDAGSFEVVELGKGTGNFSFDWRISALRRGHEGERFAPAPTVPTTPEAALK